ncbi:hypothetical protein GIB67_030424 [Kingdonia uniflora]|uniref:Chalcone synthase n=1 Tax=Kingdonia uniflora TaxID=39325 RepID=A0A7J7NE40_9MAGN|nr:hypothetical protein GIB67_030424 [Kingdonia uniflora]
MVSTRDRLKQMKEKHVSPLKIHRKPNSKKNDYLEMGDPNERIMALETTVSTLTSTVGELVEQLRLTNLALDSVLASRRSRSKKKGVIKVDGDEDVSSVKRLIMYQPGCFAGGTVLRLAKDLAENNAGARVLVALFGDGAEAVMVGADPDMFVERPLFELVSTGQTILPDSEGAIDEHLRGPAILDQVELKLGLKEEKLRATRHVLSEYGNTSSACVLFILDNMRKKSLEERRTTTGEGLEWGVLFDFEPGLTVETAVMHSVATY